MAQMGRNKQGRSDNECLKETMTNDCFIAFMSILILTIIWAVYLIDKKLTHIAHILVQIREKLK